MGAFKVYILAEILAVPAVPLTASSGYLFGLLPGTLTVLTSATIAASISFYIGRTFLRSWAQDIISGKSYYEISVETFLDDIIHSILMYGIRITSMAGY